jgi:hypothetical protein
VKRAKFTLTILDGAGFNTNVRSLDRWAANIISTGSALSRDKKSGACPALSDKDVQVLIGWVLHRVENKMVGGWEAQQFIERQFRVRVTQQRARNYISGHALSSRLMRAKDKGFKLSEAVLCEMYHTWIKHHREHFTNAFQGWHRSTGDATELKSRILMCSVDCTFTGHANDRHRTYALPRDMCGQPKLGARISRYTNCMFTCVWSDGKNRAPAVMYVYNPMLRRDRTSRQG